MSIWPSGFWLPFAPAEKEQIKQRRVQVWYIGFCVHPWYIYVFFQLLHLLENYHGTLQCQFPRTIMFHKVFWDSRWEFPECSLCIFVGTNGVFVSHQRRNLFEQHERLAMVPYCSLNLVTQKPVVFDNVGRTPHSVGQHFSVRHDWWCQSIQIATRSLGGWLPWYYNYIVLYVWGKKTPLRAVPTIGANFQDQ